MGLVTTEDLTHFTKEVSYFLKDKTVVNKSFEDLMAFPISKGKSAIYVMNWQQNSISYQRGVFELLGYKEDEFDSEVIHSKIHPEDKEIVSRVIKGIVNHCVRDSVAGKDEYLKITYRMQKKNGDYIKLLRQSGAHEIERDGKLISNWSIVSDIGFISNGNYVEWDINASELNRQLFKQEVYAEFKDFFTPSEIRVIEGLLKGFISKDIADMLCISPHTVSTHRKNIYRKSNCSNRDELIAFCKRNGII